MSPGTGVVVMNAGSSSLKVRLLGSTDSVEDSLDLDAWDGSPDHPELSAFLAGAADRAGVIGHRVVHGGSRFSHAVLVDDSVIATIADLTDLAPLHQPRALAGIEAARQALPGVPCVACFDTAFHATMPDAAARYALPQDWVTRFGLRRYGFHGLSHGYAAGQAARLLQTDPGPNGTGPNGTGPNDTGPNDTGPSNTAGLRIVTCHLGAGASLAAVQAGRSVDTTMGFTPLEGLVMATRSGSVDPGLIVWLLQHGGLSADEVAAGLDKSSGLAGLSGIPTGDLRDVLAAADRGDPAGRLAVAVYVHRLRREIAAMAAAMDGLDVLVFTGGVGEHSAPIRAKAADGLGFLGIAVDPELNEAATGDADITARDTGAPDTAVRILVITAREDVEIARQSRAVLTAASQSA